MESSVRRNSRFEVLTPEGWASFTGIVRRYKQGIASITVSDGKSLECSLNHKLEISPNKFIEAENLEFGQSIIGVNKKHSVSGISIDRDRKEFLFDLIDVENGNKYLTNDLSSHNCVEFQGSSGTLIAGWKLKELHHQIPIYKGNNGLNQYEKPIEGNQYVLVADCGEGVGLDKSAFSVFDTTKMPYKQVCTFTNNLIPPTDYAHYIHYIAKMYNNAFALVETNAIGSLVQNILHEQLEYENVFFTQNAGPSGKKVSSGFGDKTIEGGIKTTKKVKQIGCSIIKLMIEQNQLILQDFDTIYELSRFSRKGTSYEAEDGAHDDLVMTLVLFAWLTDQAYFKEIMSIDTVLRLRAQSQQQIIDEVTPFGFIDYGVTEAQQHTELHDEHDKYNPYQLNDDQIALLR